MKKNVLSLADQLKVANYLRNNQPVAGESLGDITKRVASSLDLVVTEPNIRAVLGAIGLKSLGTGVRKENKTKVIVEALINLHYHNNVKVPDSLKELARTLDIRLSVFD